MKLETIYNDLIEIINDDMNATKVLKLKEKLEKAIREENCVNANYPNFKYIIDFDRNYYETITLDFDDIAQFYKLHNKHAEKEFYKIKDQYFNIKYLKNIIDVLGTDLTVYSSIDNEYRPIYFENKNRELGLVMPTKKY